MTKEELLRSAGTKVRYLKKEDLMLKFSDEELNALLYEPHNVYNSSADALFLENYKQRQLNNAQKYRRTSFTVAEDDFIKKSYKHLSDNTLALALHLPSKAIKSRRNTLGLVKQNVNTNKYSTVIIWNNRGTFEQDCKKFNLTKSNELNNEH